ncbi:hypothetical protein EI555_011909, partial [Monodon monoceros]
RAVTIAGVLQSVTECTKQICLGVLEMLSQSPEWRVKTILYQPMPDRSLVICEGQHTISPLHLAKLNQVARQHSHFAVMHGETGFARIDSSLPEIKAIGQITVTGSVASISLARNLINARLSSEKGM